MEYRPGPHASVFQFVCGRMHDDRQRFRDWQWGPCSQFHPTTVFELTGVVFGRPLHVTQRQFCKQLRIRSVRLVLPPGPSSQQCLPVLLEQYDRGFRECVVLRHEPVDRCVHGGGLSRIPEPGVFDLYDAHQYQRMESCGVDGDMLGYTVSGGGHLLVVYERQLGQPSRQRGLD